MKSVLALAEVAKDVERTFISHLQEGESYDSVFVVGDIVVIHPHYAGDLEEPDSARIKMTLREPETGKDFAVLVFGQPSYSVSCNVNVKSRLALSGFRTEPNRGPDASLLLVLGRTSHYRIWEVAERSVFVCNGSTETFASVRRRRDFYAVVRSSNSVDKKAKAVTIDITAPSVNSLACRIKNFHAKMAVFPAEPGDVLRVRGASFLLYSKAPTIVATCANVAVFKRSSLAAGKDIEAFSPDSNVKLDIRDEEIDAVLKISTWNELRQRELRKKEKIAYINALFRISAWDEWQQKPLCKKEKTVYDPKRRIDLWELRPPHRLSSIAVLQTVDVFCVVAAVHRVTAPRSHVCLTVCDGTVPAFVALSQPSTPPAGSKLIRRDDEAYRLFRPKLVSVSVLNHTWSRVAAALPLGAHVRLNGLTVRRNKRENRYWIVLDSSTSKQGLYELSRPCPELTQSIEVLKDDSRRRMDVIERARAFSENKDRAALLDNVLQKQQDQLSDISHFECESEDELF